MLNPRTIEIVKATAPVLAEHGETLTRHFYQRMFTHNPEVAPLFNRANQGAGTQQRALAGAICAYAANIDNLAVLGPAVELIAQKHASLRILPEHYPIVGANLLGSIREVLGEAATDEVIAAWAEAYGFLADIMIGREKQIYEAHAATEHGWTGFKEFKIVRREMESEVITSFYLEPAEGKGVPSFKPGQYITLRLPHPGSGTTMRNYSLSCAPGEGYFRISVKREEDGFVSNYLHTQAKEGGSIEVGPPCGEFFLDTTVKSERPLVLISAGVGITPVLSMLQAALREQPERPICFIHCALNGRVHAFRSLVRGLQKRHPQLTVHFRYSDPTLEDHVKAKHDSEGFLDSALLEGLVPDRNSAYYYFCGPKPFMIAAYRILKAWSVPAEQVHFEFFGPRQELEAVAQSATAEEVKS